MPAVGSAAASMNPTSGGSGVVEAVLQIAYSANAPRPNATTRSPGAKVHDDHASRPARWRLMDGVLAILGTAGLAPQLADLGYHAIMGHIEGSAQQSVDLAGVQRRGFSLERASEIMAGGDYPHFAAHVQYHVDVTNGAVPHPDTFAWVLDLILDRLEELADR